MQTLRSQFPSFDPAQTVFQDSHCHLDFAAFDHDREAMLARAESLGVERFLIPGVRQAAWARQQALSEQYPSWRLAFGLHPYFIAEHTDAHLDELPQWLARGALAVGEIGLDATVGEFDKQLRLFQAQLDIAAELQLPVILHHRKTLDVLHKLVRASGLRDGIVHAFSGSLQQAQQWIDLGFRLGVGGVATYPRAQKTRAALAQLPAESLVLETDSPDMPLSGYQGQRNEPARVVEVFQSLCALRR